jgi:acetylornithine deacetylase
MDGLNTQNQEVKAYALKAIELLKQLIAIPSLSKEEDKTADLLENYLKGFGHKVHRKMNNVWVYSNDYSKDKPTILLNSHHDTVKPNQGYTQDPFTPTIKDGKLIGLGSNDAGGPLVALIHTFLLLDKIPDRAYNLIMAATAEEEISGKNGIEAILPDLGKIDLGIVGEPTLMQMAVAEKGLMVLDCTTKGKSGHAARNEGVNAIYKALKDIKWFSNYQFPKVSDLLGPVKMSVTQINAGTQHNVVPDTCTFVVDVRVNECYSNQELWEFLQSQVDCEVKARSFRLNSSSIPLNHPLVKKGKQLGLEAYGSPTLSDQALMSFPTLKIGPGDSARSHTADEYIYLSEIEDGINIYLQLLNGLILH